MVRFKHCPSHKNTTYCPRILHLLQVRSQIKDRQMSPKGSPQGGHSARVAAQQYTSLSSSVQKHLPVSTPVLRTFLSLPGTDANWTTSWRVCGGSFSGRAFPLSSCYATKYQEVSVSQRFNYFRFLLKAFSLSSLEGSFIGVQKNGAGPNRASLEIGTHRKNGLMSLALNFRFWWLLSNLYPGKATSEIFTDCVWVTAIRDITNKDWATELRRRSFRYTRLCKAR